MLVENERFNMSRVLSPTVVCRFLGSAYFRTSWVFSNFIFQHFKVNKYTFQCGLCVVEIRA